MMKDTHFSGRKLYSKKAFYGDIEKEGFDSFISEGTTDFNIRGGMRLLLWKLL